MNTQVKERLTGAVILVTLVVLLVPELLTGPGHATPVAQESAGRVPLRSYTIDLASGDQQRASPASLDAKEVVPMPAPASVLQPVSPAVKGATREATVAEQAEPNENVPVAKPAAAPAAEPPPILGWSVQLGSFVSRDNAQRLVRDLKRKGFTAFILEGGGTSGKLYRVRVGPVADRAAATVLAAKLRAAGQPGSIVY